MNTKFSEYRESMKRQDHTNCSVSTFYGTLGVISAVRPKLVVLENVSGIGSESVSDSNLSKALDELSSLDGGMYACRVFHITTSDYILPQNRTCIHPSWDLGSVLGNGMESLVTGRSVIRVIVVVVILNTRTTKVSECVNY